MRHASGVVVALSLFIIARNFHARLTNPGPLFESESTFKDLLAALEESSPRYAVFDHEYKTKEGHSRNASKLYFISFFPQAVDRMQYVVSIARTKGSV